MRPPTAAALLPLAAVLDPAGAPSTWTPPGAGMRAVQTTELPAVPARAGDTVLTWAELDQLLVDRYAFSEAGRFALDHLVRVAVLEHLASERGLEVTGHDVARRWGELDRAAREGGRAGGLAEEIQSRGMSPATFRELLRLGIVQERLTRDALELPPDAPVSGDQQSIWLQQVISQLGLETPLPPWEDGAAARCGPVAVPAADYVRLLRTELPPDQVREACEQLILVKRLRARMPDLAPDAVAGAVEAEIARRRREAAANSTYGGVDFDSLLRAQGRLPESFPRDPAVLAAALTTLWVDRTHGKDGLRRAYEDERGYFESRYGAAAMTHLIFLSAARRPNALHERSFDEAHELLNDAGDQLRSLEDFAAYARMHSDDPYTKSEGGRLGWVTRGAEGVPTSLREAVFDALDAGPELPAGGRVTGPVELENGVALLWLEELRPSPGWEEMSVHVHRELRGRFAERALPRHSVETFLDVE